MKAFLSGYHEIDEASLASEGINPAFRKATLNMQAAFSVCHLSIQTLHQDQRDLVSLIVSTQFGEVSSSLEFLTTYYDTGLSKPILFQNSLHNSTLGFVTIQLAIKGPAITLSSDEQTDTAVQETARSLLELTPHVLICLVDIVPDFLKSHYAVAYPALKAHLGWARAFLISKVEQSDSLPIQLDDFKFSSELSRIQNHFQGLKNV